MRLGKALLRLEGEGMVAETGGRAYLVRHVGPGECLKSLRWREVLEPGAAALVAQGIRGAQFTAMRQQHCGCSTPPLTDARTTDRMTCSSMRWVGNEVTAGMLKHWRNKAPV